MVALIETHDWTPVTSHTTFLSHNGRKADIEPQRLFSAGANPAGAGVWFTGLNSKTEMIVAEGIESALAAAILYDAGACVATLSTHGMRTLVLPPSMRWPVRIFADNDRAGHGLSAARDLYRRLRSEGREVVITMPDAVGDDANDVLLAEDARVNDGVHDVPHDEADPFEALLKRAEELKNGDDVGLEALAKAAIEAKLSLPRIDKLQRAAIKPTGFALIVIRKVFDEVRGKVDRERTAQKQADPSVAAAEEAARLAAIEAEKAAREAERERLWQSLPRLGGRP